MVSIIIVNKTGEFKEKRVTDLNLNAVYKHANLKNSNNFNMVAQWNVKLDKNYQILLYAKDKGRAGSENKFEFPPPVENELYFGDCVLINKLGGLTIPEWEDIYNYLYGGFEDLDDDESEDDEEKDDLEYTKEGYVKDGFIADDSDDEKKYSKKDKKKSKVEDESEEEDEFEDSDESEEEVDFVEELSEEEYV